MTVRYPLAMTLVLLLLLLLLAPGVDAIEARDFSGLDVAVERIGEPVIVDGVQMRIQRAQGIDVQRLAARIERRWQGEGGTLRHLHQQGWQMLGRWHEGRSDLIQWRGEGRQAVLLYSRLDTQHKPLRQAAPPFSLPFGCAWGRVVEGEAKGRRYLQRSAVCRGSSAELQPAVRTALDAQGWVLRSETAAAMELGRGGMHGTLLFAPGPDRQHSALVWIGASTMAGKPE
jgi:hypothetical protein